MKGVGKNYMTAPKDDISSSQNIQIVNNYNDDKSIGSNLITTP